MSDEENTVDPTAPTPEHDRSRAVVEQVKGVVMLVYGITAEQAADLLGTCSQDSNISTAQLAERIATCLPTLSDSSALWDTRVQLNRILLVPNAHGAGRAR
ncbi:ANTAR domain-containing protein [Nocardia sp. NBC_01377]|uniref:ANTAR domain-containing protein n=1 Tax=Nocardia sp. NBC_01377 TaxID=2903595 RepID=UPI003249F5BE